MHIEDIVRGRRTIKGYDPSFSPTRKEKDHPLDLALYAPSALNLQHVWPVEVNDLQLRTQLREVAWGQAQITGAATLVVVCARLDSWEHNAQRVWDGAPEAVQAFVAGAIDIYYRGKSQIQRDEVMRSCGPPVQTLMLVVRGQDLDPYPMDGFDFDTVARLINLPGDRVIGLMIAVGKKAVEPWSYNGKLPWEGPVIRDHFWLPGFP